MNTRSHETRGRTEAGGWLHFAAAPAFAAMALVTGVMGAAPARVLCQTMGHGWLSPDGMSFMYLLMAVFHAAPWWQWMVRRTRDHKRAKRRCAPRTEAIESR